MTNYTKSEAQLYQECWKAFGEAFPALQKDRFLAHKPRIFKDQEHIEHLWERRQQLLKALEL